MTLLAFLGLALVYGGFLLWANRRGLRRWYFFCFLGNFLNHVPLPLVLLLLFAMLTFGMGEEYYGEYGIDKLVWHDDWQRQLLVGVGFAVLILEVLFIGYMLWLRDHRLRGVLGDIEPVEFRVYAWRTLESFLLTAGAVYLGVALVALAAELTVKPLGVSDKEVPLASVQYKPPLLLIPLTLVLVWFYERPNNPIGEWFRALRKYFFPRSEDQPSPAELARPTGEGLSSLLKRFFLPLFVLGIVAALYLWFKDPAPAETDADPKPPSTLFYLWLLGGAYAVVFLLRLIGLLWEACGVPEWPLSKSLRKRWADCCTWLDDYCKAPLPQHPSDLQWMLFGASLVLWALLLYPSVRADPVFAWGFFALGLLIWGFLWSPGIRERIRLDHTLWRLVLVALLGPVMAVILYLSITHALYRPLAIVILALALWGWLHRAIRDNRPLKSFILLLFLAIWAWLLFLSLRDGRGLAFAILLIGLAITLYPSIPLQQPPPGRIWFMLALLANGLVTYAGLTWLTSFIEQPTAWTRVAISLLALPAFLLVLLALVLYAPAAAARFYDYLRQLSIGQPPPAEKPDTAPYPQEQSAWRLAAVAFVSGWLFFASVCNIPRLTSPVLIVFALVFVAIALYGIVRHSLRPWLTPLVALLILMAVLSGLNPYKFRFQEPLNEYSPPKSLGTLLQQDQELAAKQRERIIPYLLALFDAEKLESDILRLQEELRPPAIDAKEGRQPAPGDIDPRRKLLQENLRRAQAMLTIVEKQVEDSRPGAAEATAKLVSKAQVTDWWPHVAQAFDDEMAKRKLDPLEDTAPIRLHLLDLTRPHRVDRLLEPEDVGPKDDASPRRKPKKPLILIVVKGGGLRSAVWTLRVLHQLERQFAEREIDFPAHVRLIAGASGGMLGASCYVGQLTAPGLSLKANREDVRDEQIKLLERGFINPLMQQLVFGDVPNFFSPWPAHYDRGIALEDAWKDTFGKALNVTFAQLREREAAGWCPSLIFAPMMVEDGRRLIISNLELASVISNDMAMLERDRFRGDFSHGTRTLSIEALQLFRLFPRAKEMPLRTAVRMSASFPYFSPAVSLPTWPRRRVVDAGYYDNYGVSLAASWLATSRNLSWLREHVDRVCLIQIRDGPDDSYRRLAKVRPDRSTEVTRALEELASPPQALEAARVASASFRNDGQLETLWYLLDRNNPRSPFFRPRVPQAKRMEEPPPFFVLNLEYSARAALNWHLSQSTLKHLDQKSRDEEMQGKIEALLDVLFPHTKKRKP